MKVFVMVFAAIVCFAGVSLQAQEVCVNGVCRNAPVRSVVRNVFENSVQVGRVVVPVAESSVAVPTEAAPAVVYSTVPTMGHRVGSTCREFGTMARNTGKGLRGKLHKLICH